MLSARRRKSKTKKTSPIFLLLGIIFLVIIGVFFLFKKSVWNGEDKINIIVNSQDGNLSLLSIDPEIDGIALIKIPDSVEVTLSRHLGEMRLKNVWQLGENEGLGGRLLAEAVTKNFQIPLGVWGDRQVMGFWQGGIPSLMKAVFSYYQTNLTFTDRLKLALFSFKVKDFKKITFDLAESAYLTETKLVDGERGYVISGVMPQKILATCSDSRLTKSSIKVEILDAGAGDWVTGQVGEIIEAMGAKVALIRHLPQEEIDCVVYSKEDAVFEAVGLVFGCIQGKEAPEGNFDLVIKIGSVFTERF